MSEIVEVVYAIVSSFKCKINTSKEEAFMVLSLLFSSSFLAPKRGISGVRMSGVGGDSFTFGIRWTEELQ